MCVGRVHKMYSKFRTFIFFIPTAFCWWLKWISNRNSTSKILLLVSDTRKESLRGSGNGMLRMLTHWIFRLVARHNETNSQKRQQPTIVWFLRPSCYSLHNAHLEQWNCFLVWSTSNVFRHGHIRNCSTGNLSSAWTVCRSTLGHYFDKLGLPLKGVFLINNMSCSVVLSICADVFISMCLYAYSHIKYVCM